ncbi:hypothetical protein [Paraburkholderia tuberum]|uniref:Transposase n=1 Tax=Paraburkholderia tuberum TaxID=157910 RepID=A0A1H1KJV7_9BURK|nr:hypothetical protein [Paraburkholderia tuberum]SDR62583.1 transposase [Paraburkholderia tuberum]
MDTPGMTRSGQDVKVVGSLYVAFELGDRSWKLCLGDGVRSPSGCTVAAGNTAAVLKAIARAKVRCRLPDDAPVRNCYEAGRDGFWLHRWASAQPISNREVDPVRRIDLQLSSMRCGTSR